MSAIIATAFVQRKYDSSAANNEKISDLVDDRLQLPANIRTNPTDDLLPYLNAVQVSGYESNKRRKVFIIGNTGKRFTLLCIEFRYANFLKNLLIKKKTQ